MILNMYLSHLGFVIYFFLQSKNSACNVCYCLISCYLPVVCLKAARTQMSPAKTTLTHGPVTDCRALKSTSFFSTPGGQQALLSLLDSSEPHKAHCHRKKFQQQAPRSQA